MRALLAFLVASVMAVAQGAEHSHASTPDAAQCAICHWGKAEPAPPLPVVAHIPQAAAYTTPGVLLVVPVSREPRGTPPVRGPPSLA
ncbi:MAG TPA: hypothetical protein VLA43_14630 [Longimicrobiales bacterium]|nr:hypothetical protein [Longimicrobiales bacterium]